MREGRGPFLYYLLKIPLSRDHSPMNLWDTLGGPQGQQQLSGSTGMLRHLVGVHEENTIAALKELLGVTKLDVVLIDSLEEYFLFLNGEEVRSPDPDPPQVH